MTASPLQRLTAILREARAVPVLHEEAVPPSCIYDPLYRAMVISLTMRLCGKSSEGGQSLAEAKLKLFQFAAVHPELVPSVRKWASAHAGGAKPSLEGWARFPRGYAADTVHERVLTYLVATGECRRLGSNLVVRTDGKGLLISLANDAEANDRFTVEREALRELSELKITLKMLGA